MDKKLISEDIQNMKYLFGYKPGRVISEQEQPEIDEYFYFPTDDEDFDETGDNEFDKDLEIDDLMNSEVDDSDEDYLGTDEIDEDIFDGWDDPDNFKSERIGKIDKLEDDEFDDLEDFGDFGIDDDMM